MRLPALEMAEGLDVALLGIPWDGGTTNRAGARHGLFLVQKTQKIAR